MAPPKSSTPKLRTRLGKKEIEATSEKYYKCMEDSQKTGEYPQECFDLDNSRELYLFETKRDKCFDQTIDLYNLRKVKDHFGWNENDNHYGIIGKALQDREWLKERIASVLLLDRIYNEELKTVKTEVERDDVRDNLIRAQNVAVRLKSDLDDLNVFIDGGLIQMKKETVLKTKHIIMTQALDDDGTPLQGKVFEGVIKLGKKAIDEFNAKNEELGDVLEKGKDRGSKECDKYKFLARSIIEPRLNFMNAKEGGKEIQYVMPSLVDIYGVYLFHPPEMNDISYPASFQERLQREIQLRISIKRAGKMKKPKGIPSGVHKPRPEKHLLKEEEDIQRLNTIQLENEEYEELLDEEQAEIKRLKAAKKAAIATEKGTKRGEREEKKKILEVD